MIYVPLSKPDLTEKGKEIRFGVLTTNYSTFSVKRLTATLTTATPLSRRRRKANMIKKKILTRKTLQYNNS